METKIDENQMYIEIGRRLADLRKLNNLTQRNVETRLGVRQETMSMIESGIRKPSIALLKQLVELYHTTYDKVLGEPKAAYEPTFPTTSRSLESIDLLFSLCQNAGSEELETVVAAYINMWVYCLIREIYEANPKNTSKLFSIDKDEAVAQIMKYIEKSPVQLSAFIKASGGKIKKNSIEPPLEKAAEFREFIKQSESYISDFLIK